ncbi:DegV family protein [Nocardioides perillae]|uniref:DegV family protein with EDD domain n=1 Tax=Nocardioides perillae TaxID=1119534 RepID=A0A7Y9RWP5_9ACTN|nr:DegV family protein with EDD domain [Nocardioides perillae]
MGGRPVVVTDSTASLPPALVAERGLVVVPLQVVIGSEVVAEGDEGATPERVAEALRAFVPVSTSRPSPESVLAAYVEAARASGTDELVSVHLSGDMSGTAESAHLAAREAATRHGLRVLVVDTRQVGVATGYAALAAADVLDAGGSADEAAAAARRRAAAATSLFYVDTLEHLRRGGRIGAAAALLGSALAVKPLLRIEDGRVGSLEKVRTSARALSRLEDLAVEAAALADDGLPGEDDEGLHHEQVPVDVGVFHLANPDRAAALAAALGERLADRLEGREVWCGELGAVLGAHVGPGMVAVCTSPRV